MWYELVIYMSLESSKGNLYNLRDLCKVEASIQKVFSQMK